jgi:hypothetical protein
MKNVLVVVTASINGTAVRARLGRHTGDRARIHVVAPASRR